jgi:hypothetical protein
MLAEIRVEGGVQSDVAAVIQDQVELDVRGTRMSIGVQKGPPIGVQKRPPSLSGVTVMDASFALVAA